MNRRQRYRRQAAEAARSPQAADFSALPSALDATAPAPDRHPTGTPPGGDRQATGTPPAGDRPATGRRRRRWHPDAATAAPGEPPAGQLEPPASPDQAAASTPAAAPPPGPPEAATAAPAAAPAPDAPADREALVRAEFQALLGHRAPGGWTPADERGLMRLARLMVDLSEVDRRLEDEGPLLMSRNGRPSANPLMRVRSNLEMSIRRARSQYRLTTTTSEAQRHGRHLAAAGNDLGLKPDGSLSMTLAFTLDPDELLARPPGHDFTAENDLHARLYEAGEVDLAGNPIEGGQIFAAFKRVNPAYTNPPPPSVFEDSPGDPPPPATSPNPETDAPGH